MPPRHSLRLLALLSVVWLASACASTSGSTFQTPIAGTRVSLAMPESFWLAEGFQGVVGEPADSTIVVTEMSEPASRVNERMTEGSLAERGMELIDVETVEVDGADCQLIHVQQNSPSGIALRRWILVLGDAEASTVLVASTPVQYEGSIGPELVRALHSAERDASLVIGPFDGLGFTVDETETFEIAGRDANVVSLRARDAGSRTPAAAPQVIVGRAFTSEPADVERLSDERLAQTPDLSEIAVTSRQAVEIDGMPAFELVADAFDDASQQAITLFQTVAIDGSRYYLVQGRVAAGEADRFVPEFRTLAAGFRRVD
jgi:hypothetical protein